MEAIKFNERDEELLKKLSDEELYVLNYLLLELMNNMKRDIRNSMFYEARIEEVVQATEMAAKEVAIRYGYSSEVSIGKYGNGTTYYVPEYRHWLKERRQKGTPLTLTPNLEELTFMKHVKELLKES